MPVLSFASLMATKKAEIVWYLTKQVFVYGLDKGHKKTDVL